MIRKILVGTDGSDSATLAVEEAGALARAHGAELVLVYVKAPVDPREVYDPAGVPDADAYFAKVVAGLGDVQCRTLQVSGDPAERICDVAEEENADVIVVGSRGTQGRRRWFLGSVPNAVVQHSPCSVFIVDTRAAQ